MLTKAFDNGKKHGLILKTVQTDWRWLGRNIEGKFDAIVCLGNSFTHIHDERSRRRALAEFYAALKHDGVLIIDHRNYDEMIDEGFSSKHKYFYCGDTVKAEPIHIDEDLARFEYSFDNGESYTLNLCPLRLKYMKQLLQDAGFERIRTYADFLQTHEEDHPDFYIHVVEKNAIATMPYGDNSSGGLARSTTEAYYNSAEADAFYHQVWGGEDLHLGIYDETDSVKDAARATVHRMASLLPNLTKDTSLIDLGAGFGGSARQLVEKYGVSVVCLNLSQVQNDYNFHETNRHGMSDNITITHGIFEDIPQADESFDVVWSQDAFIHSGERLNVLSEAYRVLKPGGQIVFSDPMEADDIGPNELTRVYDRLNLDNMGSISFYQKGLERIGFTDIEFVDLTPNIGRHYARILEELDHNIVNLNSVLSQAYLDRLYSGLENWVDASNKNLLTWGIFKATKPA